MCTSRFALLYLPVEDADMCIGAMTNMVKDRPVTAHVFEYTTSFALDPDLHFKYPDKGIVPCQIIFCMKENNVSDSPSGLHAHCPRLAKSTLIAGSLMLSRHC